MLGVQIEEGRGKRTGRRLLSTNPLNMEATAEEEATIVGVRGNTIITYTATIKPDGSLDGIGDGVFIAPGGDIITWKGIGTGRYTESGSIQYCGSVSFSTTAQKFMKLNAVSGVFQWEIDAEGNTHSKMWEMAPAGVVKSAGA